MSEFNSAYMQINTGGGSYQDSYLRVKSLSDGKGGGIGGHWGGNDFTDTVSQSGVRGRSNMYSETFYDRYRIKSAAQSHWGKCGTSFSSGSKNGRRDLVLEEDAPSMK